MKSRVTVLGSAALLAALSSTPAHLHAQQTAPTQDHEQHHPATPEQPAQSTRPPQPGMMGTMDKMKAADQRLDALVKKMNAAKGAEKTDAIAELLTALVQEHRTMHESMMSNMASVMGTMGTMSERGGTTKK